MEARVEQLAVAPGVHDVTVAVQLDDRRRQVAAVEIGVDHILPVQDQYVIVVVDAQTTQTASHPAIRERLGPGEIDLITWRPALRGHA